MIIEVWKDIEGFEDLYQISNLGRIKSLGRIVIWKNGAKRKYETKILKPAEHQKGYNFITLTKNKKTIYKSVHRLVAYHFIPNPDNKPQVNHIDGDVRNNYVNNLEWNTNSENNQHSYRILGRKHAKGMLGNTGIMNVKSKKLYQFTLDGEFLKCYESGRQAALITGFKQGGISSAARGRYKKSHGFRWSYSEKPNPL